MKKKMIRIATVICLMVSVMLLGQATAFADEVNPVHEYKFDGESNTTVIDSGSKKIDGLSTGTNHESFFAGYDEIGKARYFNGTDDYLYIPNYYIHTGKKSIRFKMKKDASTVSNKLETIMTSTGNDINYGYYIGIGSEMINNRGAGYPTLSSKTGTIYIASITSDQKLNFEIQTPGSVCDGQWHDILFTWDGTTNVDSVKLYLDDMSIPVAKATPAFDTDRSGCPVYIGKFNASFTQTMIKAVAGLTNGERLMYNGYLDDVQIYDSVIAQNSTDPGDPGDPGDPTQPTGNKALLVITMVTGERKEYEITTDKINDFVTWYNSKAASSPTYVIEKDYNRASFTSRKDYIAYDQISNFEVNEYNE